MNINPEDNNHSNAKRLIVIIAFVGFIAVVALVFFIFSFVKNTEIYSLALDTALLDLDVQEALGTPITDGFFFSGSMSSSGDSGNADFVIPISGPNGSAKVYVVAEKKRGQWFIEELDVVIEDTNITIDLLE